MSTKSEKSQLDSDDESFDPKAQRRSLKKGECIPMIPTLAEQVQMAWAANEKAAARPRGR